MKKKLRLQIEKLRVEQFEAHPASPVTRGTVHGFETDDPRYTCYWSQCDETEMTYWSPCG
jgi:hypothetical protein